MNHVSRTFRTLSSAWQQDASSEAVDQLAAHFCATVAQSIYTSKAPHLLLQVHRREQLYMLEGLRLFLKTYGLCLIHLPLKCPEARLIGVRLATRRDLRDPELTSKVRLVRRAAVAA